MGRKSMAKKVFPKKEKTSKKVREYRAMLEAAGDRNVVITDKHVYVDPRQLEFYFE